MKQMSRSDIPVEKRIDKSQFPGPDRAADSFNNMLDMTMREAIPDSNTRKQVLSISESNVQENDLVSSLPLKNIFQMQARNVRRMIDENADGRKSQVDTIQPPTAKNWFGFYKRYFKSITIEELHGDINSMIDECITEILPSTEYSGADEFWTVDEVKQIIDYELENENYRYAGLWMMCFLHGRRIGEVLPVKWEDITEEGVTYNIEKKDEPITTTLPVYDMISDNFDNIKAQLESELAGSDKSVEDIDYVYYGYVGGSFNNRKPRNKPMSARSAQLHLESTTDKLQGFTGTQKTKTFRHSIATEVSKEQGMKAAQDLLRHKNPEITMRVYAKHIPDDVTTDVESIWGSEL